MKLISIKNSNHLFRADSYRYDIDGLRAIAVMAVVIGHTFENILPGGYLGVDVFFAISGFVITMSLLGKQHLEFGEFIGGFFLRRIKRLMPALLVCITLTSGVLLMLDSHPKTSLSTGVYALFGMANFSLYMQELDYFSASIKYNAFTHMWSLGVEEQFYLLFPFIFWAARWLRRGRTEGLFNGTILFCSIGSLIGFFALQENASQAAYYMMPFRFWELGAGVLAAMFVDRGFTVPRFLASRFASIVLVLLLFVIFIVSSNGEIFSHFVAVFLTTILLVSGASSPKLSWVLSNPASEYIGRISYSLYLWHWPLLTFGLLAPSSFIANSFVAIACALVAAVLSYHYVEQPFQRIQTPVAKLRYFVVTFGAIFVVIVTIKGANEYRIPLKENTFPPAFRSLPESGLEFNPTCVVDGRGRKLLEDTFSNCTFTPLPSGDQRTLWVLGDSHAGHLQAALVELRSQYGFGFHLVETPGVVYPLTRSGFQRDAIMKNIRAAWKPGDVVVLSRLFFKRKSSFEIQSDLFKWLVLVDELAYDLNNEEINLLLIGPAPMFNFLDIRACDPLNKFSCGEERDYLARGIQSVHSMLVKTAESHSNVRVLEVFSKLCPKDDSICHPADRGVFLFRDSDHLNVEGAARLVPSMYETLIWE